MNLSKPNIIQTIVFLTTLFFHTSCTDNSLDIGNNKKRTTDEISTTKEWIYEWMDFAYFWNEDLPSPNLETTLDPEEYFYQLLKTPEDKWSFVTNDAENLLNYFQGNITSMGYSLQLYYFSKDNDQIIAQVEFVYPNSPASEAGIKRGDIIYKINGTLLTSHNYQTLLSLNQITVSLGVIDYQGAINEIDNKSLISKELHINPVLVDTSYIVNEVKVGYLAYTSFISKYDSVLIEAFAKFKSEGVEELILDLRYNSGGEVSSAIRLASLIAPTSSVGDILISEKWNSNLSEYNKEIRIEKHDENINLERVFILTTSGTASASELVIYGLAPHMEVVQIGDVTYGKYYSSITIYEPDKAKNWAIQPIVARSENKTNDIDYSKGLPPTYPYIDNYYNAQLGSLDEHFLAYAISLITNTEHTSQQERMKSSNSLNKVSEFKQWSLPYGESMITTK